MPFHVDAPLRLLKQPAPAAPPAGHVDVWADDNGVYAIDPTGGVSPLGGAPFVPTRLTVGATFNVDDDAQALMVRRVVVDAGARIVIGANSTVIQVA